MLHLLEIGLPVAAVCVAHIGQVWIARLGAGNVGRRKAPPHIARLPPAIGCRAHHGRHPVGKDGGQRLEVSEVFVLPLADGAGEFAEGLLVSGD